MSEPTDEELMMAYQGGDEAAFQALYRRHSAKVYGFVRSKLKDPVMADDVFQGTFLKLHSVRSKYDPTFPFAPWLFTICRSVLIDALRKQSRAKEDGMENLEEAVAFTPAMASALPGLDALSETQKKVVQLRYGSDLTFDEIAKRINTSPTNVRKIVSRSLGKLRMILTQEEK